MENIFDFATSELSQDAMIAWTLSQINSENRVMKTVGRKFLLALIGDVLQIETGRINSIEVFMQRHKIDVLAIFETITDGQIALIIEDKTYTLESEDQIDRYKKKIQIEFPDTKTYAVYFKIGTEFNLKEKYKNRDVIIFNREKIISIFRELNNISNGQAENYLIKSYLEHVEEINNRYVKYNSSKINDWNYWNVFGFIDHIHGVLPGVKASYVNNQNGGGFVLYSGLNDFEEKEVMKKIPQGVKHEKFGVYKQVEFKFNSENKKLSSSSLQYRLSAIGGYDENISSDIRIAFIKALELALNYKDMKREGRSGKKSCSLISKTFTSDSLEETTCNGIVNLIRDFFGI